MPPAMPEPNVFSTPEETSRNTYVAPPEFRNQYGLKQVKAHHAYAPGTTGAGVTLGIVDSGIAPSHPKFAGKLEASNVGGYDPDFSACDSRASDGSCLSLVGHGTFVAGIMAASRRAGPDGGDGSASTIHGGAFDAHVISVGFCDAGAILEDILGENPTPEQVRDLPGLILGIEADLEKQYATAFERLNGRSTVVNASFGLPGNIEDFDASALRARFPNVINAIAQGDTPAGARTIHGWAAGNSNGEIGPDGLVVSATSVDITAGLPVRIPELAGHWLAVVATDREGRIARFSSLCGIAKDFCLAALGVDVTGPVPGVYCADGAAECYLSQEESGTSSAALFVTGGIGPLAQHYRNQLGNDEIVERMLATADRTGEYAASDVYGRGFLGLDAATRPVGRTRMLTGQSLSGPSAPSRSSLSNVGGAFGDSLAQGLASQETASFDELDAPFFHPLGAHHRLAPAPPDRPAAHRTAERAHQERRRRRLPRGRPSTLTRRRSRPVRPPSAAGRARAPRSAPRQHPEWPPNPLYLFQQLGGFGARRPSWTGRAKGPGAAKRPLCHEHLGGTCASVPGHDGRPVGSVRLERQYRDRRASWRSVGTRSRKERHGQVYMFCGG